MWGRGPAQRKQSLKKKKNFGKEIWYERDPIANESKVKKGLFYKF